MNRPFKILGLQQIAVGSSDKTKLTHFWRDILGVEIIGHYKNEAENVDEDIGVLGKGSEKVELDLMCPIDEQKKPAVHIPPLNHIGLWVDHLEKAVDWLTEKGVRFTPGGIRKGAAGQNVIFIHPKGNEDFPLCGEGVLIELVQAPGEMI